LKLFLVEHVREVVALLPLAGMAVHEEHREHALEVRLVQLLQSQKGDELVLALSFPSYDRVLGPVILDLASRTRHTRTAHAHVPPHTHTHTHTHTHNTTPGSMWAAG
jgi:hypothetical protein